MIISRIQKCKHSFLKFLSVCLSGVIFEAADPIFTRLLQVGRGLFRDLYRLYPGHFWGASVKKNLFCTRTKARASAILNFTSTELKFKNSIS